MVIDLNKHRMQELYRIIMAYKGIEIYDTRHAMSEFAMHFPNTPISVYKKVLMQGIDKIDSYYGLTMSNYMIESRSTGIRIPLEIRPDRYSGKKMGAVPTTLGKHETININNEIEIYVENKDNKNTYKRFPLTEGFNKYVQSGNIFEDYDTVEVD